MCDMIKTLSGDTVTLLKCSQVVTSVWSAVKELIENSLDAGATNLEVRDLHTIVDDDDNDDVQVKLEDYGMDKIEVRDNGHGVSPDQVEKMVAPHTTSKVRPLNFKKNYFCIFLHVKINEFGDMDGLTSYGFRGEALSSLCSLSTLSIVTRTSSQPTATTFNFDHKCRLTNSAPSAARPGTCVTATKLFSNLPVRKNYYKDSARRKEELKKVERIVQGFSIIHANARVSLHHNKAQIFQVVQKLTMIIFFKVFAFVSESCSKRFIEKCGSSVGPGYCEQDGDGRRECDGGCEHNCCPSKERMFC